MKSNQKGFGLIEIILALAVVGLIIGVGWYVLQHNNKRSHSTEQTVKTKSYIDSSNLYSLNYPETWTAKEDEDCCEGPPKDFTKVPRGATFIPPGKSGIHAYGLAVQADSTDSLAKRIEQNWADNKQTPASKMINGHDAKYVRVAFSGDAENYIDHKYLITHGEASVFVTFREKYYHQFPAEDWSATRDMNSFNAILNSITF